MLRKGLLIASGMLLIAVSEGVRDKDGKILVKSDSVDAFSHVQLEGVGDYLANVIKKN